MEPFDDRKVEKSDCLPTIKGKLIKIAVIGASQIDKDIYAISYEVGKNIAQKKAVLVCGGLGGVMEASARGAKEAGGITIGILPTEDEESANRYIDIKIPTPMGFARNAMVVTSSHSVIAIDGSYGTLSEIGYALTYRKPLIGLSTWEVIPFDKEMEPNMIKADDPAQAVEIAIREALKYI